VAGLAFARALDRRAAPPSSSPPRPAEDGPLDALGDLVVGSEAMQRVADAVRRLGASHSPLLITGEPGSGKAHVARAVHAASERRDGPWRVFRCAHVPPDPLAARLLGRRRADGTLAPGALHDADGGTLVLTGVEALPGALQAALLRVLDTGLVRPTGAPEAPDVAPEPVDVRLVATTSADLAARAADGRFRLDLYRRLRTLTLHVPPLRARRADVPVLARRFVRALRPPGTPLATVTARAMAVLVRYDWPGNVRQLRNEIERALLLVGSEPAPTIDVGLLSPALLDHAHADATAEASADDASAAAPLAVPDEADLAALLHADRTLSDLLADAERAIIERVLDACAGQVTASAEVLGLTRQGLYKKMKRLGIDAAEHQPAPAT
jgi:DNA-binding NtrC family response regulator